MSISKLVGLFAVIATVTSPLAVALPVVPVSVKAGFTNPAAGTSPVGTNLAPVTDFTREYPFANFFRQARPWFPTNQVRDPATGEVPEDTQFNCLQPDPRLSACPDTVSTLSLDSNGNVRSLVPGQSARSVIFAGAPNDPALQGKRFTILYQGEGTLEYSNVQVVSQSPGRDVIRLQAPGTRDAELIAIITLVKTEPLNPLRNIRMVQDGGICRSDPTTQVGSPARCPAGDFLSFAAGANSIVFNPGFLSTIKSYHSLRFMDWMRTNNSSQASFATRPLPSNQFWNTEDDFNTPANEAKGVPLEVMIALANLMDQDPWFNVPHRATDGYVTSMATLIRNQLEPGRRAYIEYSNEVWNGQFTQTTYAVNQGKLQGLNVEPSCSTAPCRNTFGMLRFYSRRARQVFDIFEQVFTAENPQGLARIERVMASQAVNSFFTDQILSFEGAAAKTDSFAIAPYFGDTITPEFDPTRRDAFVTAGVDGVFAWLTNTQGAPDLGYGSLAQNSIVEFGGPRNIRETIRFQKEVTDQYDVGLVAYEGGQHFLQGGRIFNDDGTLTDAEINVLFDAVNRDVRMKQAYLDYLGIWKQEGGGIFHHYVNSDSWSEFGRWGAKEFPTQTRTAAKKYDALLQFIADNPLAP